MKRISVFLLSVIIGITCLLPINALGYSLKGPGNYRLEYQEDLSSADDIYYNVNIDNIYYTIIWDKNGINDNEVYMTAAIVKGPTLKIPERISFKGRSLKVEYIDIDGPGKWKIPYKTIVIPRTVKHADFSSANLEKVRKIYVPKNTELFGVGLSSNPKLKLIMEKNNLYHIMKNGALYSKNGKTLDYLVNRKKKYNVSKGTKNVWIRFVNKIEKVNFPSTAEYIIIRNCSDLKKTNLSKIKKIRNLDIEECNKIEKVKLSNKLTKVKKLLIESCSNLKTIDLGSKTKKIKDMHFRKCTALKKVVLPENLNKIYGWAFFKCISLEKIDIPKNVKKIEYNAFCKCKKLSKVEIESEEKAPEIGEAAFESTADGIEFIVKNQTIADQLKEQLTGSECKVKNAKILIGDTVVYENING